MIKPLAKATRSPRVNALMAELLDALPPGATAFLMLVGPVDAKGGREIVLGGDTTRTAERAAAAQVLDPETTSKTLIGARPLATGLN